MSVQKAIERTENYEKSKVKTKTNKRPFGEHRMWVNVTFQRAIKIVINLVNGDKDSFDDEVESHTEHSTIIT